MVWINAGNQPDAMAAWGEEGYCVKEQGLVDLLWYARNGERCSNVGALLAGPIDSTSVLYVFLVFHKNV